MDQVTQAIQNAIRPAVTVIQGRSSAPALASIPTPRAVRDQGVPAVPDPNTELDFGPDEDAATSGDVDVPAPKRQAGVAKVRTYKTPEVIELDLKTEPSWDAFAKARQPESTAGKYLVVAAWCKEARGISAITAEHVYTCFRAVKWPTSFKDFMAPFRALKKRRLMSTSVEGEYIINHIGLQQVEQMTSGH